MYEYIKGEIAELSPTYAIVEAGGIGYYLHISLQTFATLQGGATDRLWLHQIVRDDVRLFYGFASRAERETFRLLIGVSGVGAAIARMILSAFTPTELATIISTENSAQLKSVKGLGLKTAQKIIVELRDKITAGVFAAGAAGAEEATPAAGTYEEALSALIMLGFPRQASEKTLRDIVAQNPASPVEEVVRLALKQL